MSKEAKSTKETLQTLFSGKGKLAKRFAGKHVIVVGDKVLPLKEKHEDIWRDIELLKKKYGEMPMITFVPRHDITYILLLCK